MLRRDGETLLHRAVRLARTTAPQRLLVVLGAQHESLAASLCDLECETLHNPDWELGLSSSVRRAVQAIGSVNVPCLLLGCDQPALEREHLQQLLVLARGAASACAATLHGDRVGVPALVSPALWRHAARLQGDRGLREALNAVRRNALGVMQASELRFDLDTPDDLSRAQTLGLIDPD